jgi:hypothetical protein
MFMMVEIFSGLASMSRSDTKKPRSMPLGTNALLRVQLHLVLSQLREHLREVWD